MSLALTDPMDRALELARAAADAGGRTRGSVEELEEGRCAAAALDGHVDVRAAAAVGDDVLLAAVGDDEVAAGALAV